MEMTDATTSSGAQNTVDLGLPKQAQKKTILLEYNTPNTPRNTLKIYLSLIAS